MSLYEKYLFFVFKTCEKS